MKPQIFTDEHGFKKDLKMTFFLNLLLIFSICFSILSCVSNDKINKGNEPVAKIENFKTKNGRLPNSLSEIGIEETESGPIYYQKKSDSKYILWFGKELGESVTYDSETKQWK